MDGGRVRQLLSDAKSYADAGDMLLASQLYIKATEINPENAAAWYGLGVVQISRGFPDESVQAFERANMLDSEHAPTAANLAVLLENIDPVRSYQLALMAVEKLGSIQQLSGIIERQKETIIGQNIYTSEVNDKNDDYPLLESRGVDNETNHLDEAPLIESREVVDGEELILESRPVLSVEEIIVKAKEMLTKNRANEALSVIKPRLETDGSMSFELWSLCATTLYMIGHNNEALEAVQYAIAIGDDTAKTHYNHSQILKDMGKSEESEQSVANALISDPEHVKSLISMGEIRFQSNDYDEALSFWERAHNISPEDEILSRINSAKENMGKDSESFGEEQPLVETMENKIALAKELTIKGDHVNSVKTWKQLLEDNREMPEIWNGMADSLSAAGHVDRALQCRQKAKSLELENSLDADSDILQEPDLIAAGIEAKEIIENMDNSPEINANVSIEWYNKGVNLLAEGKGSEALSSFEKSIGGAPKEELELRVKAQAGRGHALYQMGKYGDSIRSYHTAISMDPEGVSGKLLYNMGSSYASLELFQDAVKCFIQALDRGLDENDRDLCKKQLSRCKILAKEQARRSSY
ncbi:MAG TPA: tetratricopeptide repeat protein [Candidatus Thalassarchaeaceae archaeon]|jgi:tetratricopeptide (TPR) repeat protein|nr:MAG TPA: hypothetical protein D7H72_01905 [Candidatus Poseidoniales archaeon]HII34737.1 tetratricopeptide repeat protein [Candidatus Thalassarchaeaceae archaeon]|tara:strand:- start:11373 stop:13130 length:1758 start_codon:yes stop_codon:yes gene_type:complete